MIDFNSIEVVKFVKTFNLTVTNDSKVTYKLLDPFGCEFTMNSSSIVYKFPKTVDNFTGIDTKVLTHIIKSMEEFADYWVVRQGNFEINFDSENRKKSYVKLNLR